jgi:hypothetical protein
MHLHPMFHVSLLELYAILYILDQVVSQSSLIQLANAPKYEVKAILDSTLMRNKHCDRVLGRNT